MLAYFFCSTPSRTIVERSRPARSAGRGRKTGDPRTRLATSGRRSAESSASAPSPIARNELAPLEPERATKHEGGDACPTAFPDRTGKPWTTAATATRPAVTKPRARLGAALHAAARTAASALSGLAVVSRCAIRRNKRIRRKASPSRRADAGFDELATRLSGARRDGNRGVRRSTQSCPW